MFCTCMYTLVLLFLEFAFKHELYFYLNIYQTYPSMNNLIYLCGKNVLSALKCMRISSE